MEEFPADWLALREPYDRDARARHLARAFLAALPREPLVADLGCGRGANAAYLSALCRRDLRWLLVDGDADLLLQARRRCRAVGAQRRDLARSASLAVLDRCDAVTASALCDLVSHGWVDRVIGRAASRGLPVYFALTVDGRIELSPRHRDDAPVLASFRHDQRRDKGFGPALGAAAIPAILASMRRHGYRDIRTARSDWRLLRNDSGMLAETVSGLAAPSRKDGQTWRRARRSQIDAGEVSMVVGHMDILALPTPRHSSG